MLKLCDALVGLLSFKVRVAVIAKALCNDIVLKVRTGKPATIGFVTKRHGKLNRVSQNERIPSNSRAPLNVKHQALHLASLP